MLLKPQCANQGGTFWNPKGESFMLVKCILIIVFLFTRMELVKMNCFLFVWTFWSLPRVIFYTNNAEELGLSITFFIDQPVLYAHLDISLYIQNRYGLYNIHLTRWKVTNLNSMLTWISSRSSFVPRLKHGFHNTFRVQTTYTGWQTLSKCGTTLTVTWSIPWSSSTLQWWTWMRWWDSTWRDIHKESINYWNSWRNTTTKV